MSRTTRWRRLLRWILRAAAGLLLLVVALLLLEGPILRRFAVPRIEAYLEETLDMTVRIEEMSLDLAGRVALGGVRVSSDRPPSALERVAVARIVVAFDLGKIWRLIRGDFSAFTEVRVESPRVVFDLERSPLLPEIDEDEEVEVPLIRIHDGKVALRYGPRTVEVSGIDALLALPERRLAFRIGGGRSDWEIPRLEAVRFPIRADARLAGPEASPFDVLLFDLVRFADERFASDLRVEIEEDAVEVEGAFPALEVRAARARFDDDGLSIAVDAAGTDLARAARFVIDREDLPHLEVFGTMSADLAYSRQEDWKGEADLRLRRIRWPELGLSAPEVAIEAVRKRGVLETTARAARLEVLEGPPLAFESRVRQTFTAESGYRVEIENATVELDGGHVRAQGVVGVSANGAVRVEDGHVRFATVATRSVSRFLPGVSLPAGRIEGELRASGLVEPPELDAALALAFLPEDATFGRIEADVEAAVLPDAVDVPSLIVRRGSDRLELAVSLRDFREPEITIGSLEGRVLGYRITASGSPMVAFEDGSYRLEGFELELLGGRLSARARGDARSLGLFQLDAAGLFVSPELLAALIPGAEARSWVEELTPSGRLDARVTASALWEGPDVEPQVRAELLFHDGRLAVRGARYTGLEAAVDLHADGETLWIDELRVELDGEELRGKGALAVAWDRLPEIPPESPVDFELDFEVSDLSRVPLPPEHVREIGGRVSGLICIGGTLGSPDLVARAAVSGGSLRLAGDFPRLRELQGAVTWNGHELRVEDWTGTLVGRPLKLEGRVSTSPPWVEEGLAVLEVDMNLEADKVLLLREPDLRVRGDVALRWHGPWDATLLEGQVDVVRSYYRRDVELSLRRSAQQFELFRLEEPPLRDMRFDVRIRSRRGIILMNNIARSRASADLHLGGTGERPLLTGTISTDEGTVTVAASKLELRSLVVEFRETDPYDPRLQITLEEEARGYRITVTVTGTLSNPEILLDSVPPLESDQLLVLLTTGYTVEAVSEAGLGRVAALQLATYFGRRLIGYFGRGEPQDDGILGRLSLETEAARKAYLEDLIRLEYRVAEDVGFEGNEIFLQTERDTYGNFNFNFGVRVEVR